MTKRHAAEPARGALEEAARAFSDLVARRPARAVFRRSRAGRLLPEDLMREEPPPARGQNHRAGGPTQPATGDLAGGPSAGAGLAGTVGDAQALLARLVRATVPSGALLAPDRRHQTTGK